MTLAKELIKGVGTEISKSVFSLWLEAPVVGPLAKVVGILAGKGADYLAQRAGRRHAEKMAEEVAENMLALFVTEGVQIDEGGQVAVARAAAETLRATTLTHELLTSRNLDPAALRQHYLARAGDATRDFAVAERELYERIIAESCEYMVDIAAQMPGFTSRTLGEVLRREDAILGAVREILEEVRRSRQSQISADAAARRFEAEYRRAVVRRFDRLELFGADVKSRRYNLSVAYVTLFVERRVMDRDRVGPHGLRDQEREIVPATRALASSARLFVRGPAGSGKTTLLQWVAVNAASRRFVDELTGWNELVPFFVRLREFSDKLLPRPENFAELVAPAVAAEMPRGWVHEALRSGRAVVLIDGLDEVAESQRQAVYDWLRELVKTFAGARFMLSSRPHAADPRWLGALEFHEVELQDMSMGDMQAFIAHWHRAVAEELDNESERSELGELQRNLEQVIARSPAIRMLAVSPLLCALICALHRDRVKELPSDRIELYRACRDMFLRRDRARRLRLEGYPELTERQKCALLEDLAYWMLRNGLSQAPESRVDIRFAGKLGRLGVEARGSVVRRLFVERSGILRQPAPGLVDFPHRTFQEFMAAQAAVDENDIGVLVMNAHDSHWREMVILAAGLARTDEANDLMTGLVVRGEREAETRHLLYLLAVECLNITLEPDDGIRKKVEACLATIVPPSNFTEAKTLATVGDPVAQHLRYAIHRHAGVEKVSACVRTLALVGSDVCLEELRNYAADSRKGVLEGIYWAWENCGEPNSLLQGAIRCLGNPESPDMSWKQRVQDLRLLRHLGYLQTLDLSGCGQVEDLGPLRHLGNLQRLNLSTCVQVKNLGPLQHLGKLQSLNLAGCRQVEDLGPLQHLGNLQSLNLSWCRQVQDLGPLQHLGNLQDLRLSGCEQVEDLGPLQRRGNLESLDLSACEQVKDLGLLQHLSNLQSLRLSGCGQVEDLGPLQYLGNLQTLDLSSCWRIQDLGPLQYLGNLQDLRLSGCGQVEDLGPLQHLGNLQTLVLSGCWRVRNLGPLQHLDKLQTLVLHGCSNMIDFTPVKHVPKIER